MSGRSSGPARRCSKSCRPTSSLIVQARFSPNDIASVHSNHEAEVRFPAFHSRTIPVITGMLELVSSDRLLDDQTHAAILIWGWSR